MTSETPLDTDVFQKFFNELRVNKVQVIPELEAFNQLCGIMDGERLEAILVNVETQLKTDITGPQRLRLLQTRKCIQDHLLLIPLALYNFSEWVQSWDQLEREEPYESDKEEQKNHTEENKKQDKD